MIFSNAWRRTDAYLLIGVQEVKGARSIVYGVTHHIDDASLQQLVNKKTQKPITFSYEAFPFEGKQVGVIRIPVQERPFYLLNDFGKLKKKIVYIRRGSSTDEADPSEVAQMRIPVLVDQQRPLFELEFAEVSKQKRLNRDITVVSTVVKFAEQDIPVITFPPFSAETMFNRSNQCVKRLRAKPGPTPQLQLRFDQIRQSPPQRTGVRPQIHRYCFGKSSEGVRSKDYFLLGCELFGSLDA